MIRILVIDDDPMILALVRETLELENSYDVTLALNGEDAIASFRERPHDLVITDVFMPGKDGLEIMQLIHRIRPRVPFIVMSGESVHIASFALRTAARDGAAGILEKPFSPKQLIEMVHKVLEL
ncbi:MAG: response regulator [Magnetococcales bacterium]|nr:response regulator [Magnetococcales bacterium]